MKRTADKRDREFLPDQISLRSSLYFLLACFVILILAPLFQKGCFLDGMLYKTVAYNYAEGLSSFWDMKFTNTSMSTFCEQPPLYFFLLGKFYKVFGTYYLVDRFFTLILFCLFLFTLVLILKELFRKWLPYLALSVFFFFAIPVFCWSYVNQIIEPLLCVLTGSGILFFLKFLRTKKTFMVLLFALTLILLFLGKGFQSCFIVVLPVAYMFLTRFEKRNYYFALAAGLIFACSMFFILRYYAPARQWLECYYKARLVLTLNNVGNTTDNHFEIIGRFFSELIVVLIFFTGLMCYLGIHKKYPLKFILKNFMSNKLALSLLITSFAGSFPYAISLVQRGFYLIPSFICFVLAMVYGFKRYWLFLFLFLSRITTVKLSRFIFPFLAAGSLVYFCFLFGTYKRNEALLKDVDLILPYLKKGEIVSIESERWNDFGLHAYLYMDKQVSLAVDKNESMYVIRSKERPAGQRDSLERINLNTQEIDLYVRK